MVPRGGDPVPADYYDYIHNYLLIEYNKCATRNDKLIDAVTPEKINNSSKEKKNGT